jgi:hypothetical protein
MTPRFATAAVFSCLFAASVASADNPLVLDQFTADPTARVFDGRLYVYPSHDIPPIPGKTRPDWFAMADYHVFSTDDLTTYKDHGVIVTQSAVPWVDAASYSMWAPDCVRRDGRYYFYFPARGKDGKFHVGVATADAPTGPFLPEPEPITGVSGIDPCVLIDKDGQAYLYYSQNKLFVAKLKPDMRHLDGPPQAIANLPEKGLKEGPFVFERQGTYYLTYPHVAGKIERLEYATGPTPTGPFTVAGVIMDESPSGCWTNHQSVVQYQNDWYLFYHDNQLSPAFDKNRSIRADRLHFKPDGSIRKVTPTLRGVGTADARRPVQIDRHTAVGPQGTRVAFVEPTQPAAGWFAAFDRPGAWLRYDRVNFGRVAPAGLIARCAGQTAGRLEVRLDSPDAPPLARLDIAAGDWSEQTATLSAKVVGVHDLFLTLPADGAVRIDWLRFE